MIDRVCCFTGANIAEAGMDLRRWSASSSIRGYSTEDRVIDMARNTTVLALAATVFSDKRFGDQAANYVRAFFLDTKTGKHVANIIATDDK